MELDVVPSLSPAETSVLAEAVRRSGIELDGESDPYASAWRRAGLVEAADGDGESDGYARSPRSTRGATRA
jgi:hypothetical protein